MSTEPEIEREIRALEERLLARRVRSNPDLLGEILAEEFLELGSSGRRWGKRETLQELREEPGFQFSIGDFRARLLSPTVALATYRLLATPQAGEPARTSLRSSVWVRASGRWQLAFHQGTPASPAECARRPTRDGA